jgi:hypothetical protein
MGTRWGPIKISLPSMASIFRMETIKDLWTRINAEASRFYSRFFR